MISTARRETAGWRGAGEPVSGEVFLWQYALPSIVLVFAAGYEIVTPGEFGIVKAAASCKFPFGFGWQGLAIPSWIGFDIAPCDVHHRAVGKAMG